MTKQKPKVLVLAHDQFGYSVTKFKHCEYASDDFDITYIGWDYGLPRYDLPKVKVKYVSRKSNSVVRNLRLLYAFHKEINTGYDFVFANYVRGISLVKLCNPSAKSILYIDTLAIDYKKISRWFRDFLLMFESLFFEHIALINRGISEKIRVHNYNVLPLGGERFSTKPKTFDHLSLLYVGTLGNRNILECVKGFHKFLAKDNSLESPKPTFTIVGDGPYGELGEIKDYIKSHKLEPYIRTTGFVRSDKLYPFFEKANIGVSYVPITSYFTNQPPTKTFEYLISGLPVIATATEANKEIVTPEVCELIADTPDSFCSALVKIQQGKHRFNSERIRKEYEKYTWENVVKENFVPLVKALITSE